MRYTFKVLSFQIISLSTETLVPVHDSVYFHCIKSSVLQLGSNSQPGIPGSGKSSSSDEEGRRSLVLPWQEEGGGMGWDALRHHSSSGWGSLSANRAMLVYAGRGSLPLWYLPPQKGDREKQLDLNCRRIRSRLIRGWKCFLEPAGGRLADLLAVILCQLISPAGVLTGEGKMCLCSRNCVEC